MKTTYARALSGSRLQLLRSWARDRGLQEHDNTCNSARLMIVSPACPWFGLYSAAGLDKTVDSKRAVQVPALLLPHLVVNEAEMGRGWIVKLALSVPNRLIFKDDEVFSGVEPFDDPQAPLIKRWTQRYELPEPSDVPVLPQGMIRVDSYRWLLLDWSRLEDVSISSHHHVKVLANSPGLGSLATYVKELSPHALDGATTKLVERLMKDIEAVRELVSEHLVADMIVVEMEKTT